MSPSPSLYDPSFEHDACGVGMVCCIDGTPSFDIVQKGLQILKRLDHRGAVGADPASGDGAGILIQTPHRFMEAAMAKAGVRIPREGDYAIGVCQFSRAGGEESLASSKRLVSDAVLSVGLTVLGWRRVPTQGHLLGPTARRTEPTMWQVAVSRTAGVERGMDFEQRLYLARRRLEKLTAPEEIYVSSLSPRVVVYKGMLTVDQLAGYYPDLTDPLMESAVAMVHSRFSTNTMPQWSLAQPFRHLCHNGEINTVRGNAKWMQAREALFSSIHPESAQEDLKGVLTEGGSDSQRLDQALELLRISGRSLPHALMMLIPEAWERDNAMSPDIRAFYEYQSTRMEPWDGPAAVLYCDGRYAGATLDRNGLRPARFVVTHDGCLVLGSEAGTLDLDPASVKENGRLQPGRMLLVDLDAGRLVDDADLKAAVAAQHPYAEWVESTVVDVDALPEADSRQPADSPALPEDSTGQPEDSTEQPMSAIDPHADSTPYPASALDASDLPAEWVRFGYTRETIDTLLMPLTSGKEALGSMGRDVPVAVLSNQERSLFDYFKQLFAQVTNPPLDAIREELVTSLTSYVGGSGDLLREGPSADSLIRLNAPVLSEEQLRRIEATGGSARLNLGIQAGESLKAAVARLRESAALAVESGVRILVLSDSGVAGRGASIPSLLAVGAVHHHLIREGLRMRCSLLVSSGEPREVHHIAALLGYGASVVHPWLALATIRHHSSPDRALDAEAAEQMTMKALSGGVLKVMSKMGISTLQSYTGAQIFEALGVSGDMVDACFTGTATRIGGVGYEGIQETYTAWANEAVGVSEGLTSRLQEGGIYRWRRDGEHHVVRPMVVAKLQEAARQNDAASYGDYAALVNDQAERLGTLRGLLDFVPGRTAVPLDEVEPWTEIVKRFKTGAMSYGSISGEAHSTLAEAMNRIGGRSNTGEGGEDTARYDRAHPARSRIKQVASGRFGVTIGYLVSGDEIQIKMAQGAKPGEGGQLPGEKVHPWIARTRHSTPWVGLISPPPHHDIYSIEDLAQLIFDLRNANPEARISVKLVSEAGVGTIAAGVAKAKADVILIAGHDGGTGAAARTSIMHAGLPWELGLAEAQQTLVRNGLRRRVRVECDGGLKTGRDVAIAALLGADEFGFATAPLIAMGCIMMRKCHLNTCPVGIATQNPELRERFRGLPEHVINYFHFVAEELRGIMAELGVRSVEELTGRSELLLQRESTDGRAGKVDLSRVLAKGRPHEHLFGYDVPDTSDRLAGTLDRSLIAQAAPALERREPVVIAAHVNNTNRTIGTQLSGAIVRAAGPKGLPHDTVTLRLTGTAGQSFCAFGAHGLSVHLTGQANDYFGKGLSGARVVVSPPDNVGFRPHEQIVVGNVALYGATSGTVHIRGRAGERFAVRNSGAVAVVEGVGDHGCEYMTGGRVIILGPTGRNFAAGMSGGVAYVLDGTEDFRNGRCSRDGIELERVTQTDDIAELRLLVEAHLDKTGSSVAEWVLNHWDAALNEFVKVIPTEYKRALERLDSQADQHEANFAAA